MEPTKEYEGWAISSLFYSIDEQLRLKLVCDAGMTMQVHSNYDYCYEMSSQHETPDLDEMSAAPIRWMAPESIEEGVFSSNSNVVSSHTCSNFFPTY